MKRNPTLIIYGRMIGLNEYINFERSNRFQAAKAKKDAEQLVHFAAKKSLGGWRQRSPVIMHYHWFEPNRRRDKDNISSYGRKIIQDTLVKGGWLNNDGWNDIVSFTDDFAVDKKNPRIEVEIEEI